MTALHKIASPPKHDRAAFAFLIAMGLAVAVVTGASLTGLASGALQDVLSAAGFGRDTEMKAEQRRQAFALSKIETSLGLARSDIASLGAYTDSLSARMDRTTTAGVVEEGAGGPTQDVAKATSNIAGSTLELAGLRTSLEEHEQRNQQQFIAVNKRIDWLETLVYSRDLTGSVQPSATPAPTPARRRHARVKPSWFVLHAQDGVAVIGGRTGTLDVTPGFVIPELGKVMSIEQQSGHWVVVAEKGSIKEH